VNGQVNGTAPGVGGTGQQSGEPVRSDPVRPDTDR
jgi:hypothetical protein